jgi:hypothetical protein
MFRLACRLIPWSVLVAGCASTPKQSDESSSLPTYEVQYIRTNLDIDGRPDEPEWRSATPMNLVITDSGRSPRLPTTARMLWDDDYLYVAFDCADRDLRADMALDDDNLWEEDEVAEIFIQPRPGSGKYLEFELNPRNTKLDLDCTNPTGTRADLNCRKEWNCTGWHNAVHLRGTLNDSTDTDEGWSCEMAIPIASVCGEPTLILPGDQWRVNLYRVNRTDGGTEYAAWSRTQKLDFHIPQKFGVLIFQK